MRSDHVLTAAPTGSRAHGPGRRPARWTRWGPLLVGLAAALALAGCSSTPATSGANGSTPGSTASGTGTVAPSVPGTGAGAGTTAATGAPGATQLAPTTAATAAPSTPPPTVSVPTIVPAAQAKGSDDVSTASAGQLNGCAATQQCSGVNAPKVEWPGATLAAVDLSYAVLTGADLRGLQAPLGKLFGANLSGADLTGANLSGANLSGADLSGATLVNVNFSGANLRGVVLRNAIADGADLRAAALCQTIMPDGAERNDNC